MCLCMDKRRYADKQIRWLDFHVPGKEFFPDLA